MTNNEIKRKYFELSGDYTDHCEEETIDKALDEARAEQEQIDKGKWLSPPISELIQQHQGYICSKTKVDIAKQIFEELENIETYNENVDRGDCDGHIVLYTDILTLKYKYLKE